jgi:nucleoid DNA-binding protein
MADKLSWSELRRALANRAGVSEKEANSFLNALSGQLVEALKSDKQVKINGLGMFKLQAVAPRKSVDVTTGEEITIEGYNKIVFAPEAGLKELIEGHQPSADSNRFSDIDPIQKLGAQAEEIVDILGDLGQSPNNEEPAEEPAEEPIAEEPATEEPVAEEPAAEEPAVEEPIEEPATEEPAEEEPATEQPIEEPIQETNMNEEPIITDSMAEQPEEPIKEQPVDPEPFIYTPASEPEEEEIIVQEPPKKSHFVRDVLICVIIILLLLCGAYFFFRTQIGAWIDNLLQPKEPETVEVVVPVDTIAMTATEPEEPIVAEPEPAPEPQEQAQKPAPEKKKSAKTKKASKSNPSQDDILAEFLAVSGELEETESAAGQELTYNGWKTVEPIHEGSRLTWMAKMHYGAKIYWPYLYDANRDRINNPNVIEVGTPIRVPNLTPEQRDTTNAQTMATLEHLKQQAENAMK